jgi:hypothetical protein
MGTFGPEVKKAYYTSDIITNQELALAQSAGLATKKEKREEKVEVILTSQKSNSHFQE